MGPMGEFELLARVRERLPATGSRLRVGSGDDAAVAGVLDDLERVLIEIAHSPDEVSGPQLDDLRRDIEDRGLLFKVRVLGSQARQRESAPPQDQGKRL